MTEVLICLSFADKARVDELVDLAVAAGGIEFKEAQDDGLMYLRAFRDLDGHIWEIVWTDPQGINNS